MGLTQFLEGLANLEFVWIKSLGDLVITCMYSSLAVLHAFLFFTLITYLRQLRCEAAPGTLVESTLPGYSILIRSYLP